MIGGRSKVQDVSHHRLVVVGAGLAGLTAATEIVRQSGWAPDQIAILERQPSVGGRLATEELDGATFDHGAQFFTVRTEAFQRWVDDWLDRGLVDVWCRGFSEVDGYPRYRVVGGMNALARVLADELVSAGVEIATGAVAALDGSTESRWEVSGRTADAVLLTPPVPVAWGLARAAGIEVDPALAATLRTFDYHRVLALLAVLDRSPSLAPPGALQRPDDPIFTFVADNQAKGLSARPCVTVHTAHARSAELWDRSDDDVARELQPAIEDIIAPAQVVELHVRRWRHAGPVSPFAEHDLQIAAEPGPLVLAGDGFGSSKVEGAFSSGLAAARRIAGA